MMQRANSGDPDQTAPLGTVWSGSALFAQTYLSENLVITVLIHYKLHIVTTAQAKPMMTIKHLL